MAIDIETLDDILRAAARAEIMPRFRHLSPDMVRTKSSAIDLVTEADTSAERAIRSAAAARWPGALFVGEESVAADPALLGRLPGAPLAIVVDPVDGTSNFAAGMPLFAVMAAVTVNGKAVAGAIYDPLAGDTVIAERGGGAWLRRADGARERLRVSDPVPLAQMVGTASMLQVAPARKPAIYANFAKVRLCSAYRCAGQEYRAFISGHLDFLFFSNLMPWDHLAGTLIAAEAGATVRRLDGKPYSAAETGGDLLIATTEDGWEGLRREVFTL